MAGFILATQTIDSIDQVNSVRPWMNRVFELPNVACGREKHNCAQFLVDRSLDAWRRQRTNQSRSGESVEKRRFQRGPIHKTISDWPDAARYLRCRTNVLRDVGPGRPEHVWVRCR